MENQAIKKRQIKLNWDEAMLLSERILKDTFNCTDKSFFLQDITVDDIHALSLDVLKLQTFIEALELLKPTYLKKIRTWLRVQRSRAKPTDGKHSDRTTTMNVNRRNVIELDSLVADYNQTHTGAEISRDELLALMISHYKMSL